jgi:hypothetical protein
MLRKPILIGCLILLVCVGPNVALRAESTDAPSYSSPRAGAATVEDLAKALQDAYRAKNANAVLALFYLRNVDERTKASILKSAQDDFQSDVVSVEIVEPPSGAVYQYSRDGITYGVNLPVVKEAKVSFAKTTNGQTFTTYHIGMHAGAYYLVTAARISALKPQPEGTTDAATIDFVQKAVMRALNFAQGDRAGFLAAKDDFTPEGWSSYAKHMNGFLDDRGAPTFSSELRPSGKAAVIGSQNGIVHLSIPGTLKQTHNTSSTTYRIKIDVIAGGQPIKLEKVETVTCGGALTHPAPCE